MQIGNAARRLRVQEKCTGAESEEGKGGEWVSQHDSPTLQDAPGAEYGQTPSVHRAKEASSNPRMQAKTPTPHTLSYIDPVRFFEEPAGRRGGNDIVTCAVNTWYLYNVGSRLVNVRLDEGRLRKARLLREQGLPLSDLVREAIDERFEQLNRPQKAQDIKNIIQRIFEQHPDPADLPPRVYDVHDRKAARAAILARLRDRGR